MNDYWLTPELRVSDFGNAWIAHGGSPEGSAYCYSPSLKPLRLEDKIIIFLGRTEGWQLGFAKQICRLPHSDFAVLHIVLSFFEAIAKYYDGFTRPAESKEYFKKGVMLVFPELKGIPPPDVEAILQLLYDGARCGLYHASSAGGQISVSRSGPQWYEFDRINQRISINTCQLVMKLQNHLATYAAQLRDPGQVDLRANFEKRFDFEYS